MLIDTGCSVTLLGEHRAKGKRREQSSLCLELMNKDKLHTCGAVMLRSVVTDDDVELGPVKAHVVKRLPLDVDVVLGLDILSHKRLELSYCEGEVTVKFSPNITHVTAAVSIDADWAPQSLSVSDSDFTASFVEGRWVASWKWTEGGNTDNLHKTPIDYVKPCDRNGFDAEMNSWVSEGILVKYDATQHGEIQSFLPTMAVLQDKGDEKKIRPVLDYRMLNQVVKSFPGGSVPLCSDRLREWRQRGSNCSLLDLRKAYLQIHVHESLWVHQAVRWKNEIYLLTRLGFGLSVAPKIMTAVVDKVISLEKELKESVSSYVDDLFIDESKVSVSHVKNHLSKWGLLTKEPVSLGNPAGVRVLGIRVNHDLSWQRDKTIPTIPSGQCSRRQINGIIGELLGHFPVAGWLRVYCSFLQRLTSLAQLKWDDSVTTPVMDLINQMMRQIATNGDPVRGSWPVPENSPIVVWADASNLALGVVLTVNDKIIEDASWLRPHNDTGHINISELDAAIKGLNMALRWGKRDIIIKTDSSTVYKWLTAVINKTHNVKTRALSERLIKRRLDTLREIIETEKIKVEPHLVKSAENISDSLTRVPQKWIQVMRDQADTANVLSAAVAEGADNQNRNLMEIKKIHERCHFGVDRTLNLAKQKLGNLVSRRLVKKVVRSCDRCARIDPAVNFSWDKGAFSTSPVIWQNIAVDITHYNGIPYLTIIDLSSRYTIWRRLRNESSSEVSMQLSQIIAEFGPPSSVLSDNGTVFRSRDIYELFDNWEIKHVFSSAYRPQGNAIIERVHRTVKRCAKRANRDIEEATFWVNNSRDGERQSPYELMFAATSKKPGVTTERKHIQRVGPEQVDSEESSKYEDLDRNPFSIGDRVYLKSVSGRCDSTWSGPHRITSICSSVSVILNEDGVARHVSHLRLVPGEECTLDTFPTYSNSDESGLSGEDDEDNEASILRRSIRERKPPDRFGDLVMWCACEVCRPGGRVGV